MKVVGNTDPLDLRTEINLPQRFLKVHSDVIAQDSALADQAKLLAETQAEAGSHVRDLIQQNLCLIKFFCNTSVC